jgi:hypothetical protein
MQHASLTRGKGAGVREVGYIDCAGGGQVIVRGGVAYVGHVNAPDGTLIVDVSDPKHPRELASLGMPIGTHSHKVRVDGDLMLINRERNPFQQGGPESFTGGLGIFDVSTPAKPRLIANWETAGMGVHRFDFDGRYAYISPTVEGYLGNIVMILDLKDPARPVEVGRWWKTGQWTAGGEVSTWPGIEHRCHHPLRLGDRLYTSYWHGGFVILDISDMAKPKLVASITTSPPFPWPTHTALPIPFTVQNRRLLVVADEDVMKKYPSYPSFMWIYDISDEAFPVPFASFQLDEVDGTPQEESTGCHQPSESFTGTEIPVAWFAHGLRVVDIKSPHAPREVAWYVPDAGSTTGSRVQSNDVTVDDRGLIYLLDRIRGCHILERI